jgi:phosphoglycolate phosphatase
MSLDSIPHLVIFDLDGTLIDSRIDLCNSVNATLTHLGRPTLPEAVIATYIGDGVSMLVRRALGDPTGDIHDEEYVDKAITFFLSYYRVHKLDFTYVYPGVIEALETIREMLPHLPMAVLTNKPVNPSRDICTHFGLDRFFFQNYGGNSFHTKKPDPLGLITLIEEANLIDPTQPLITPASTIMIGDTDVDVLTARNCGAHSIGCTFGLAPHTLAAAQPNQLANSPSDWPSLLGLTS